MKDPKTTEQNAEPTNEPAPNEDAGSASARPAAKRKFSVTVGDMEFEKRCTVADMVKTLQTTSGTSATLTLDGFRFKLVE